METIAVTEVLFDAFAEGEILTSSDTYKKMTEEFEESAVLMKTGKLDEEGLYSLQYAALRAGFYAGITAMRSLFTANR